MCKMAAKPDDGNRDFLLKPEDLSLSPLDPNEIWRGDALSRSEQASVFESIIATRKEPLTLFLNGAWGTGKTFFLRRLCEQYRQHGGDQNKSVALYFNAWADDSLDDPLLAIVGQMWKHFRCGRFKNEIMAITERVPGLLRRRLPDCLASLAKRIPGVPEDLSGAAFKTPTHNAFDAYVEQTELREDLRKRLSDFAANVAAETGRPILFVFDELDRCRPLFAIETLERVKHILGVPNIVFLFGVDCVQLQESVRSVYGDVDAGGYLERFFDIELSLPTVRVDQFFLNTCGRHGVNSLNLLSNADSFKERFLPMAKANEITLREMEHIVRLFVLIGASVQRKCTDYATLLAAMMVLRLKHRPLYDRLVRREAVVVDLIDALYGYKNEWRALTEAYDSIAYFYAWFMSGEVSVGTSDSVKKLIERLESGGSGDDGVYDMLPKCLRKETPEQLGKFAAAVLRKASHGSFSGADFAIDDIAKTLDCVGKLSL